MHRGDEPRPEIGDLSPDGRSYWDGDIWQWQPLWLVPDEVIAAAHRCFGRSATTAHLLAAGLLNQSWRVDADSGDCVLRVSRPERSQDQVTYEHAVTRGLNERIGQVIAPLPGRDGESIRHWRGRLLSLFPFVEGVAGTAMAPDDRNREAATILARMHRASLDHLRFGQRPGFHSVDEHPRGTWLLVRPVLRRELAGTDGFDELCDVLDRETSSLESWLDEIHSSRRPVPRAIVHGDFNPRNLIFQDGRLVAVIDWDECRVEPIAWEVAQVGFGAPDVDPGSFWRTYLDAGGPLAPSDFDLLGGFARMGALSELQWTVKNGRATPHALAQVREVVASIAWLHDRETGMASP